MVRSWICWSFSNGITSRSLQKTMILNRHPIPNWQGSRASQLTQPSQLLVATNSLRPQRRRTCTALPASSVERTWLCKLLGKPEEWKTPKWWNKLMVCFSQKVHCFFTRVWTAGCASPYRSDFWDNDLNRDGQWICNSTLFSHQEPTVLQPYQHIAQIGSRHGSSLITAGLSARSSSPHVSRTVQDKLPWTVEIPNSDQ